MTSTEPDCRQSLRTPKRLAPMRTDIDWQIAAYLAFYEDEPRSQPRRSKRR